MRVWLCVFPSKMAASIIVVEMHIKVNVDVSFGVFLGPSGPLRTVIYMSKCNVDFRRENTYRIQHVISNGKTQGKVHETALFYPFLAFPARESVLTLAPFGQEPGSPVRIEIYISNSKVQFDREKLIQK